MYCSNLWLIYWMFSYFLVGKHGRYDIFYCCVRGAHPEACFFFFEQLWNSHITMYPGVGTTYPTHPPTMRMALVEDSSQTHDENLFVSMRNLVSLKRSLMGVFFFRFQLPNWILGEMVWGIRIFSGHVSHLCAGNMVRKFHMLDSCTLPEI